MTARPSGGEVELHLNRRILNAYDAAGQADQDRGKDGPPRAILDVPTGRGGHPASTVPNDIESDTPVRGNPAGGSADMTSVQPRQSNERLGGSVIVVDTPVEKHGPSRHHMRRLGSHDAIRARVAQDPVESAATSGRMAHPDARWRSRASSTGKYRFKYVRGEAPSFTSSNLLFGSAIHSALQHYFERRLEGDATTIDDLAEAYCVAWHQRIEDQGGRANQAMLTPHFPDDPRVFR